MWVKLFVLLLLAAMVYNLFLGMRAMLNDNLNKAPMSRFIGRRVLLSAIILLLIILAVGLGFITPNPRP